MKKHLKSALAASLMVLAGVASAQITFYEGDGFRGRAFATETQVRNLNRSDFSDTASSLVVERGRWEICDQPRFEGRCVIVRRGNYESLQAMGLENRISSVRPADASRNYSEVAPSGGDYQYRRRGNERTFEAPVTSSKAIVAAANERCWIERQQVSQQPPVQNRPNIGGAVIGGLLGGVLGHQVGGGTGKDIATVGGAVAGAAIGSTVGRNNTPVQPVAQDVRRCETTASTTPTYWDVSYNFRGIEHRVQMTAEPGRTIAVNGKGEPRL
ncbi:MAG: beta/gamma crystallin-related protein [Pseudomonadota bacterium]